MTVSYSVSSIRGKPMNRVIVSSIRMNRPTCTMLKISCIRSMTCLPPNRDTLAGDP